MPILFIASIFSAILQNNNYYFLFNHHEPSKANLINTLAPYTIAVLILLPLSFIITFVRLFSWHKSKKGTKPVFESSSGWGKKRVATLHYQADAAPKTEPRIALPFSHKVTDSIVVLSIITLVGTLTTVGIVYRIAKHDMGQNLVPYTEASRHIGQTVTVKGRIVSTIRVKGTDFLNFCADYTKCPLSVVILYRDGSKFGDVSKYASRVVLIKGTITQYKGRNEILLSDPKNISIVEQ